MFVVKRISQDLAQGQGFTRRTKNTFPSCPFVERRLQPCRVKTVLRFPALRQESYDKESGPDRNFDPICDFRARPHHLNLAASTKSTTTTIIIDRNLHVLRPILAMNYS